MIEKINGSTNLMGFLLVLVGGLLSFWKPDVGTPIITGGFGLIVGNGRNGLHRITDEDSHEEKEHHL